MSKRPASLSTWERRYRPHMEELYQLTVLDELNQRYGQNAVYFGGVHSVLDSAPTRISFSTIPDVEDF
jgi:hypothetical protein